MTARKAKSPPLKTGKIPVFNLCGGLGTRLKEETEFRPRPMMPIGEHPILWHVMRLSARHGFRRFVLCAGFKAEVVKDCFRDGQLNIHKPQGFWGCMDTQRDRDHLTELAESGQPPWLK